ncbi:penicillin-binding protein 1A [Halopseudomonas salegens]|uniref:Penicillin-binding protein 1A n=1 Tax=Halopseudomonas salegens TaxID=1434072 RepID=A0A1H2E6E2_9GAMM|nr:penicillin-binding protein 1A [Halopseudomonas salegens]SDT90772.1 penicillin-binding protein 1A [Halopseudomonas salegens]
MRFIKFLLWSLLALICGLFLALSGTALYLSPALPDVESLRELQLQTPLRIYSTDNQLIAEYGEMRRVPVSFDQVPEDFINAFLAAEDDNFLRHHGVDPKGLLRAAAELAQSGHIQTGGSTITMQVAKNVFLTSDRVFSRKLNEILLALQIERHLDKQQIFELYINKIYLGHRAYGIEAAAQVYYGRSINELSLAEMAMIAGLPKAPSRYNPLSNLERATVRRDWILQRMLGLGMIDQEAFDNAINSPDRARLHRANPDFEAPWVAEMVRQELYERFGDALYTDGYHVYTSVHSERQIQAQASLREGLMAYDRRHGYRGPEARHPEAAPEQAGTLLAAYQTLNGLLPALVIEVADDYAIARLENGEDVRIPWSGMQWARPFLSINSMGPNPTRPADIMLPGDVIRVSPQDDGDFALQQVPAAQSTLIALSPADGRIEAVVGGFSFSQSNYNRAVQAKRQSGSSFKPFLYAAALDHGYTPASLVNDAPLVFADEHLDNIWRPQNSGGDFLGPIRLRESLYRSRNLVSIRLMQDLGIDESLTYIERFGFSRDELPRHLSSSLGSLELTPLQVTRAYAVFANGGYLVDPWLIERIEDRHGQLLDYARPKITPARLEAERERQLAYYPRLSSSQVTQEPELAPQVLDPRTAYQINSILKDVITRGTGGRARVLGRSDLAGKTGTTNEQRDAWFSGYNADLVTTVWAGYDQPASLGRREYGSTVALPIWIDFVGAVLDEQPEHSQAMPDGMVNVRIDPTTGRTARPGSSDGYFEVFKEEDAPPPFSELEAGGYTGEGASTPLELF